MGRSGSSFAGSIGLCRSALFSEVKTPVLYSLVVQQNKETSTLVTTLEDGSIVYLGGETLLQYPEHFLPENVK